MPRQVGNDNRSGPTLTDDVDEVAPDLSGGTQSMQQKQDRPGIACVATGEQALSGHCHIFSERPTLANEMRRAGRPKWPASRLGRDSHTHACPP
jgi:hypothetical protein